MVAKVGIPRGLLFYRFYGLWKTFLEELGFEVIVSPPTNKMIVQQGLIYGVEEICFPVKVFLGHVLSLKDKVDLLFVPRIVSFYKGEYNCPKILGLPDLVRNIFGISADCLIDEEVNMREAGIRGWQKGFLELGKRLGSDERKTMRALEKAESAHFFYRQKLKKGFFPENLIDQRPAFSKQMKKVLLLGHTYLTGDSYINMNVIQKVHGLGYGVITQDMLAQEKIRKYLRLVRKPSFWTISNEIIGSALFYLRERDPALKGFIHLVSFECGPDSLVGELVERWIKREEKTIPYLRLEIDEHTGEAGLVTRLEAFVDMMEWRNTRGESNLSASFTS
ncbi:MAG: acyl-CoA dehydratase activase-related protein [Candidatus Caldatribacteriaceae bacterium]